MILYANMPPDVVAFYVGLTILIGLIYLSPVIKNIPALFERVFDLLQQGIQWSTTFEKPEQPIQASNSIEMEVTRPANKLMPISQKIQDEFLLAKEKNPELNMIDFLDANYKAIAEQIKGFEK